MVVWARVPDRNGVMKPEPRPLLITSVHPVKKRAPFVAHCISTRRNNSAADPVIEMPWSAVDGDTTGLFEWCAVVLKWAVILNPVDVVDSTGRVSAEFLNHVLERIAEVRQFQW
jgi:hypothetical protein